MKKLWDFISDKNNSGDEKRVLGIILVGVGIGYGFIPNANPLILVEYFSFGAALLGIAAYADKIPLGK